MLHCKIYLAVQHHMGYTLRLQDEFTLLFLGRFLPKLGGALCAAFFLELFSGGAHIGPGRAPELDRLYKPGQNRGHALLRGGKLRAARELPLIHI
jgi:hypothetical protein